MRKQIEPPTSQIKPQPIPQPIPQPVSDTKPKNSILTMPDRTVIGRKQELDKITTQANVVKEENIIRGWFRKGKQKTQLVTNQPDLNKDVDLFETTVVVPTSKRKLWLVCGIEALIGFGITYLGVVNAGSYFISGTRFGGSLFEWMYVHQFGTLFEVWGLIIIYDAIKRTGKL